MQYYVHVTNAGIVATGAVLAWEYLYDSNGAVTTNNPAFTEVGGGWYKFNVIYGDDAGPWKSSDDTHKTDLLGVIDCDSDTAIGLVDIDRYKPVSITLRSLALAKLVHKGIQNKATGDVEIYAADQATADFKLDMTDSSTTITRTPAAI